MTVATNGFVTLVFVECDSVSIPPLLRDTLRVPDLHGVLVDHSGVQVATLFKELWSDTVTARRLVFEGVERLVGGQGLEL